MKTNFLIPMAGLGKRFSDAGYTVPKPLLPVGNDTMIEAVVKALRHKDLHFIFVVNTTSVDPEDLRKSMNRIISDFDIIPIDYVPKGSAMSCMLAKDLINNDTPLIIGDCDMIVEDFDFDKFRSFCELHNADGVIGTFFSDSPKNSYIKINSNQQVTEAREKVVISNLATNGVRYWKKGKYFVDAVNEMVANNDMTNGEYYVAPSYNYMLKDGMIVMPYHFNLHFPIGVPDDYENYKKLRKL
jgi:NDP-sugar pyrophosphorylase family protein